jgi:hypothetical protein
MSEWKYVPEDPAEELAQLHFFSMKKKHSTCEIEVRITVQEFATPESESWRAPPQLAITRACDRT